MAETNINAYKAELEIALQDLDRATARVEELKAHISIFDEPSVEEVVEEVVEVVKSAPKKGKK